MVTPLRNESVSFSHTLFALTGMTYPGLRLAVCVLRFERLGLVEALLGNVCASGGFLAWKLCIRVP